MKNVYFIFPDMKEAEYYWRGIGYYLIDDADYDNAKMFRGPYRIEFIKYKIEKVNIIKRIIMKLTHKKPVCIPENICIIFKSKKSNFTENLKDTVVFDNKEEKDYLYFKELIKKF